MYFICYANQRVRLHFIVWQQTSPVAFHCLATHESGCRLLFDYILLLWLSHLTNRLCFASYITNQSQRILNEFGFSFSVSYKGDHEHLTSNVSIYNITEACFELHRCSNP